MLWLSPDITEIWRLLENIKQIKKRNHFSNTLKSHELIHCFSVSLPIKLKLFFCNVGLLQSSCDGILHLLKSNRIKQQRTSTVFQTLKYKPGNIFWWMERHSAELSCLGECLKYVLQTGFLCVFGHLQLAAVLPICQSPSCCVCNAGVGQSW